MAFLRKLKQMITKTMAHRDKPDFREAQRDLCSRCISELMNGDSLYAILGNKPLYGWDSDCSICSDIIKNPIAIQSCDSRNEGHVFCKSCIQESMRYIGVMCPFCRRVVSVGLLQEVEWQYLVWEEL
ncbi:uncharacterized protein B0I36DRAFT_355247 [Microdochium trichocladiopsis]|uniref:RING-type domain-containing protein n=1 Tax=Microdochium trichocladiopsis TaxID=1682393 RepID=A0A9P8XTW5_9PEZI|nr:uncharacterized protein B0I36DRAFT_355247 [Microdochium trichocladiopsis]KAH7016458.1 hypothetical protein B0I36DRAFT_355247 [Microdochium trichocladiopsis]